MRLSFCAALSPFLLLPLVSGCSRGSDAAPDDIVSGTVQKPETTRVRTVAVERREMVREISTTTVVVSEQEVDVMPRSTGIVTEIRVEEGDRVAAGDVLAVLDPRETKLAVDDAIVATSEVQDAVSRAELAKRERQGETDGMELTYETAKRKVERNENAKLISDQDLEQLRHERNTALNNWENAKLTVKRAEAEIQAAKTAVDRAEISLEQARLAHSYTEIRASFDGVIDSRLIHVGGTASAGQAAFVLTDDTHLRAIIHRPQRERALFASGVRSVPSNGGGHDDGQSLDEQSLIGIEASAEALPGQLFVGTIERISPSIDPASGSFAVWIQLGPAEDGTQLLPGMLLRLDIVVERHTDALVVPKRALRREGDTTILFMERDGIARRVVVLEGFDEDKLVEISTEHGTPIEAGERVIVVGNRDLEDGDELDVDTPAAEEEAPVETDSEAGGSQPNE